MDKSAAPRLKVAQTFSGSSCGSPKSCSALKSRAYGGSFLLGGMLRLSDAQYHAALSVASLPVCFALVAGACKRYLAGVVSPRGKRSMDNMLAKSLNDYPL